MGELKRFRPDTDIPGIPCLLETIQSRQTQLGKALMFHRPDGIRELAAGGGFGFWALFLGMFVLSAANGERRFLDTRRRLEGLRVRHAMSPVPFAMTWAGSSPTVRADALVNDLLPDLGEGDVLVVDDDGRVVGTIGLDHLARLARVGPGASV